MILMVAGQETISVVGVGFMWDDKSRSIDGSCPLMGPRLQYILQ